MPTSFETEVKSRPDSTLVARAVAPVITAPVASFRVPVMLALVPCAHIPEAVTKMSNAMIVDRKQLLIFTDPPNLDE
jgi:hypothetical protein